MNFTTFFKGVTYHKTRWNMLQRLGFGSIFAPAWLCCYSPEKFHKWLAYSREVPPVGSLFLRIEVSVLFFVSSCCGLSSLEARQAWKKAGLKAQSWWNLWHSNLGSWKKILRSHFKGCLTFTTQLVQGITMHYLQILQWFINLVLAWEYLEIKLCKIVFGVPFSWYPFSWYFWKAELRVVVLKTIPQLKPCKSTSDGTCVPLV